MFELFTIYIKLLQRVLDFNNKITGC